MKPDLLTRGSDHYKHYAIQPIEFIMQNHLDFARGSIIKYVMRLPYSINPELDLEKIKHFADFLKEQIDGTKTH